MESTQLIEGVGDEVVMVLLTATSLLVLLSFFIKGSSNNITNYIHSKLFGHSSNSSPENLERTAPLTENCPVCLDTITYPLQTNCGHLFCGSCILALWDYHDWLISPMSCPMCRQTITLLFLNFNEHEIESVGNERPQLTSKISEYNRRFSGASRPWIDYLYDIPTLLRQLWSDNGIDLVMRCRVYFMVALTLIYCLLPLDILPEAVFGFLGLIDDIAVVIIVALYVTQMYRVYVANRLNPMHQPAAWGQ